MQERVFESGVLAVRWTNKVKSKAAPSEFDFSSYKVGCTDRPTQPTSKEVAMCHKERAQKRAHLTEQREVQSVSLR